MFWIVGMDQWVWINSPGGRPDTACIMDVKKPRVRAIPSHNLQHQFFDASIALISYPAAPPGRELARDVAMGRHELEQHIEQLKMALVAIDDGKRYDSGPSPEETGSSAGEGEGESSPS